MAVQDLRSTIQDRAGTGEACQIKRRLTERLDSELHDVGRHGRDPVGAGLEVHLDDGIARRRGPSVEARAGCRLIDLHDRRHDDRQVCPAEADGFGAGKRLDGKKWEGDDAADRRE